MSLTEYVADYVMNLEHEDIPESVQRTVKEHILDGYGLALRGCEVEGHAKMRRYAERVSCEGEVQVLGTSLRSSAEVAATGHPRKPMSREHLEAKFFECAELAVSRERAQRVADMTWDLEKLKQMGELHKTLSG